MRNQFVLGAAGKALAAYAAWMLGAGFVSVALAPAAYSDPGQADLAQPFSVAGAPFVGQWGAHREVLTIDADGRAVETTDSGTVNFRLNFVQGPPWQPDITAYGNLPDGGYATATLVDYGRGLTLSIAGGDNGFPFCKIVDGRYLNSADCGA